MGEHGLTIHISVLDLGVEGGEARILNVHGDLLVFFRVCRTKNFAALCPINVEESAAERPLRTPKQVNLIVVQLGKAIIKISRKK